MVYLLTYSSFNAKRHAIANTDSLFKLSVWLESKGYFWKEDDLFYNKDNHNYIKIELVDAIDV